MSRHKHHTASCRRSPSVDLGKLLPDEYYVRHAENGADSHVVVYQVPVKLLLQLEVSVQFGLNPTERPSAVQPPEGRWVAQAARTVGSTKDCDNTLSASLRGLSL